LFARAEPSKRPGPICKITQLPNYKILLPCIRLIRRFETPADLFHGAAKEFARIGYAAITKEGRFTVVLSGGSTPRSLYTLLGTNHADFDWNHTFLFFGDERHVPPTDPDSNYRMVNEALLSKIKIPASNVFRVQAESPDATAAAAEYETRLRNFFKLNSGEFPCFDLILLGLGPDGHTASLFPDSQGLKDDSHIVIANWVEKFKTHRISFTYPVLNRGQEVMFLASGDAKADVVHEILEENHQPPYPAQLVQPEGKLYWMIDEAAAAKLTSH
jgi:6-phosphogluconolactonase